MGIIMPKALIMKKNPFFFVLIEALKRSVLIAVGTGLFSMIPIEILNSFYGPTFFNEPAGPLPFDWLGAIALVIVISYFVPVVAGGIALTCAIAFYRLKIARRSKGPLIGGIFGVVVFLIGTRSYFRLTQDLFLDNWSFWTTMTLWGTFIFVWLGHRIEDKFVAKGM
jgi:hypothetical protein